MKFVFVVWVHCSPLSEANAVFILPFLPRLYGATVEV
jgi:hypothetical protein